MSAYEDGLHAGKHWANHADGIEAELRQLQALRSGKSEAMWREWFLSQAADRPAFQRLVKTIQPETSGTPREVSAFWQTAVEFGTNLAPSALRDSSFVQGFADGALRVWEDSGAAGERGSELPDEDWLDERGGPTTENDT
jgi:hypothetical protein